MTQHSYLAPGTVLQGRYEIQREIGRGGYSIVYLAQDRHVAAPVAVKLLVPPPAAARVARERMRREVQSVRGIADPAIVTVYDFGDDGPWSFIVMEYVPGPDLSIHVKEQGVLDVAAAVALGRDVAGALGAAHRRGVLHRDVKPQNILLDPRGRARLTDFGSARLADQTTLTGTGGLIGTPDFAAPEVYAGRRGDARSDVYGLGLSLYFALVGTLPPRVSPHAPPSPAPNGHRPVARRPDVPAWLDDVIGRATAADPEERFSGAAAFAAALAAGEKSAAEVEPVLPPVEVCLACTGPDPLGLGICPRCAGSSARDGDTLIFARATPSQAIAQILGAGAQRSDVRDAADGSRPLVLVPAAAAGQVIDRLADRGIGARAVPRRRAWAAAPLGNYVLAAAVLLTGAGAGSAVGALLFWPGPILAVLLAASAVHAAHRPVAGGVGARRRGTNLPVALRERVVATLAELPTGAARSLLGRLVRRAAALLGAATPPAAGLVTSIESMIGAACGAALELSRLEHAATAVDAAESALPLLETQARYDAARDVLVQRLLDADAALGRVQVGLADSAEAELGALTAELEREATVQAAAAREVAALLR